MNSLRQRAGFWVYLISGTAVPGFDPEQDGLAGIKDLVRKRFPEVRQLPAGKLAAWLADTNRPRPVLLDVRQPEEFAISHLPGAQRVDPKAEVEAVHELAAAGRPFVVYCSVGYRSSALARRLMSAGVTNVFNLAGSIFQWANEGRPLASAHGPAGKVHPYNARWEALLKPEVRGSAR